jgi:hypothetical protein
MASQSLFLPPQSKLLLNSKRELFSLNEQNMEQKIISFFSLYDGLHQGCHMVCFQTKNPDLGKFWRVLQWKMLMYFMNIWSILWPLEIFYGHLVYFVVIWYIFPRFGILYLEKSGIPGLHSPICNLFKRQQ